MSPIFTIKDTLNRFSRIFLEVLSYPKRAKRKTQFKFCLLIDMLY